MRNTNPLKEKLQRLKINGAVPLMVSTFSERANAHNIGGRLGFTLSTRKKLDGTGWEIRRMADTL